MLSSNFGLLNLTIFGSRTRLGFAFIKCLLFVLVLRLFFGVDLPIEAYDLIDKITFSLPGNPPGFRLDGLNGLCFDLLSRGYMLVLRILDGGKYSEFFNTRRLQRLYFFWFFASTPCPFIFSDLDSSLSFDGLLNLFPRSKYVRSTCSRLERDCPDLIKVSFVCWHRLFLRAPPL